MTRMPHPLLLTLCALFVCSSGSLAAEPQKAFAATVSPYATDAALATMRDGGNAVDGAIAAAVTLGVVDSHNSGIGGGLFLVIRDPKGEFHAIDGRETAPAAAHRDMYLRDGKPQQNLSEFGPLAVAVPGWLAALEKAAREHGKQPLARHLMNAARLAREGFTPDPGFAERRKMLNKAEKHPETTAMFNIPINTHLMLPGLAKSYEQIAKTGTAWFYHGEFAAKTANWMAQNGGILNAADFAAYRVKTREPLRATYRGHEVLGFPPPSSGGVHVAQILNILENFDLKALGHDSPEFIHVVAEAMKLAFADRAHWLGDPDFVPVPRGLVDKAYAKTLAGKIDRARATAVASHNQPPDLGDFSKHTTHFCVADAEGWFVSCTATINTTWGSLVTIPGTGVILNNEMDDFAIAPGTPNAFGLVGAEANAVAPGKRPLSSMSPTIVLKDGKPVLVAGAAGGPTIISQVVLAIIRFVDFGQSPAEALRAPRFHQQWKPDALRIEAAVPAATREELQRRGHRLDVVKSIGVSQALSAGPDGFSGASDPRAHGKAAGF